MKVFDPQKHEFKQKGAPEGPRKQAKKDSKAAGQPLDEALKDTFPASDPPAITAPRKRKGA